MALKPGDKAPDFTINDQNGDAVSLQQFKGQKVALFFYPKDNTPTCTIEACNIRDNFSLLKKKGVIVLGISVDTAKKHKNFEKKFSLPFTLLADIEKTMVNDYGVWAEKTLWGRKYMGILRTTFLINEKGKIDHIIDKVDSENHAGQIIETWGI
ncbi:MAG: thioredoxin-dependent thiol peroxidase [Bacteroidota bacterium]